MTGTEQETMLRVSRRFDAPRERVFDAWTNPDVLRSWWAAGPDWKTPTAEVDARPGGSYRLSMEDPTGSLEDGTGTEVVLTHSGFASGEIRGEHEKGWTAVIENLGRFLGS